MTRKCTRSLLQLQLKLIILLAGYQEDINHAMIAWSSFLIMDVVLCQTTKFTANSASPWPIYRNFAWPIFYAKDYFKDERANAFLMSTNKSANSNILTDDTMIAKRWDYSYLNTTSLNQTALLNTTVIQLIVWLSSFGVVSTLFGKRFAVKNYPSSASFYKLHAEYGERVVTKPLSTQWPWVVIVVLNRTCLKVLEMLTLYRSTHFYQIL